MKEIKKNRKSKQLLSRTEAILSHLTPGTLQTEPLPLPLLAPDDHSLFFF
ncbi:hypothetical protein BMS3Abin06_00998 [bacterium BMS3Abin06]|nr:hypothetical protein BMS3Abin06_00998 [bacterium BMS3Abin06]